MFGHRSHRTHATTTGTTRKRRAGFFARPTRERRAAGLKAALHNPNTTHDGRKRAKAELRAMGRGREAHGHPSLGSRIRSLLHIPSRTTRARHRGY
ncbi:hypothetical protein AURDEDRAFT_169615 [Auricularia subglabra TFB-10046 SS5]|uniref:Uncharacterized protein n=1 Tax=Auricularia subglabra (strain TFB-10046 / SS5) TaxID=717982 RepID=J0LKG1_AURST|nr:hypothetical protein AURDEDRAFT_169615 [Auricularia subglabra TFB-10046 SS5]